MLKADAVKAGRAVLFDSMQGLVNRISGASDKLKLNPAFAELASDGNKLYIRIRVGMAGWNDISPVFGLPRYVWNSDLCQQQLEQWAAELQNLWTRWAAISGEAPVSIAKPKERIADLGWSIGGALAGGSKLVWALVALGVLGLVGWAAWRRWK